MNDTATIVKCPCCRSQFVGAAGGLCPECEKDSEFYKLSRKKGDPRNFISYPALFQQWQARRAECREWRKGAEQMAANWAARVQAEVEPHYRVLESDPTAYVLSANVHRRHLTKGQQAMAVALAYPDAAKLKRAGSSSFLKKDQDAPSEGHISKARFVLRHYRDKAEARAGKPDPSEALIDVFRAYKNKAAFPPDMWRRLVQLAHPDKHDGSAAAAEATRWLLDNRP